MKLSNGDVDLHPHLRDLLGRLKSRDRPHSRMQDCVTLEASRPHGFRTTGEDDFVVDDLRYLHFIPLGSCFSAISLADDGHGVW